jgi:hypothetical protein
MDGGDTQNIPILLFNIHFLIFSKAKSRRRSRRKKSQLKYKLLVDTTPDLSDN